MIAALLVAAALARPGAVETAVVETPPEIMFAAEDQAALDAGEVVWRYERWADQDGGVAAIVVDAPADVVWKHVLDYDEYVRFLPYVTASSTDRIVQGIDHTIYDCSMELTTRGIVTHYTVRNWWFPDRGYATFRMLPRAGNPLDEATGYWRVEPYEGDAMRSILAYRIDVDTAWYVPGWLKNKAADRGLPTVARLIARRAEREAAAVGP